MRFTAVSLIGRDRERAVLDAGLEAVRRGRGGAVAVVAEGGLGKSRLTRELLDGAASAGVATAVGRATPGPATPFRPLAEAILSADRRYRLRDVSAVADDAPLLSPIVPTWSSGRRADPAELSVPVVAEAFLRCLSVVPGGTFVLALEDLHWADAETLAVVEYVIDNLHDAPVLVVVTMRPEPVVGVELISGLERRGVVTRLDLTPLDAGQTALLVHDCLDGSVFADLDRFVHDRSEGNPLLAEELLAGLHASGALTRQDSGWKIASRIVPQVPLTFAGTVRQRLDRLDDDTRFVVQTAAVLGRRFDWRPLAGISGVGPDRILASLHEAGRAQLIDVIDGVHQFRHALIRDAVFETLTHDQRTDVARLALDEIADDADPTVLATLAELAGDLEGAVEHNRAAAADSRGRGAVDSAVLALEHARELAFDARLRVEVEEELAGTLVLAGRAAEAEEVLDGAFAAAADTEVGPETTARMGLIGARIAITSGQWRQAADRLAAAADHRLSTGIRAELDALLAHVNLELGSAETAHDHAEAAVSAALAAGRPEVACEALEVLGRHTRFTDPATSTASFQRAVSVAAQAGLGIWHLRALHELAVNEAFLSWRPQRLSQVREQAQAQGAMLTLAVVDLHEAGTLLIGGEVEPGLDIARRCADACRRYRLGMLPIALIHVAAGQALRGRQAEAEAAVGEALDLAGTERDISSQAEAWVHGNLALVSGDLDEWRRRLDRGMEIIAGAADTIPSPWRGQWALAAAVAGDPGPAATLRASHAATVGLNVAALTLADAVTAAREGNLDAAVRAFETGDQLLAGDRCGLPRHVARLLIAPSASSDGWGDAEGWLRDALTWFEDNDYGGLAALTRRTLRAVGVPVPRRGRGESAVPTVLRSQGVTSREMDVLLLVEQRLSNREIADTLHLSVRTVEKHVASLLAKTGVSGRRELSSGTGLRRSP